MNNRFWISVVLMVVPIFCFSQKKKEAVYTFQSITNIQVDGDHRDWQNKLIEVDDDKWSFGITKDSNKLWIAVHIKDPALREDALRNGIIVNISLTSKKKEGAQLIFPFPDRERVRALMQNEESDKSMLQRDILNSSRGYQLTGFSKVRDGLLSFDNTYGIKAKSKIDSSEHFLYESVIPLDLIYFEEDVVAVQISINNRFTQLEKLSKERQRNAPTTMYGRPQMPTSIRSPYKFKTDVWITGHIK